MPAQPETTKSIPEKAKKPRVSVRYPRYSLADSVAVAKAVHDQGGGLASRDRLAAFLEYKSVANGAFLNRIAAARLFDLITTRGSDFVITPLATKILMPTYDGEAEEGLVEAFFNVPLFKELYEEYSGKELPAEFGVKNLLRSRYGLNAKQAESAYRNLIASADQARFFATRGTRTHLIIPQVRVGTPAPEGQRELGGGGGGGGGGNNDGKGGGSGAPPRPYDDLRSAYVSTLIDALREKSKSGEVDLELMARIEKLLAIHG